MSHPQTLNSDIQRLLDDSRRRRENRRAESVAREAIEQAALEEEERRREQVVQQELQQFNLQQPQKQEGSTGLLGKVFAPFTFLQEKVIEPGAGFLFEGAQQLIPGEQEIERRVSELRAQGVGAIEARRRAWVETDLPATTVSLPFKIPLPAGRSLQTFDVGVKGAVELAIDPLNLLFGIGTAAKIPGQAGRILARGAIPQAVTTMRAPARAAKAEKVLQEAVERQVEILDPGLMQRREQAPDVSAVQVMLPEFRSAQTDLLEGRIQSLLDTGESTDIWDATKKALLQQAEDAGLPPGTLPPVVAAHFGADAGDTAGSLAEALNMPPGLKGSDAAFAKYEGSRNLMNDSVSAGLEQGNRLLRKMGIGKWDGRRLFIPRTPQMEALFKYLHKEGPLPEGLEPVVSLLRDQLGPEEATMLAAHPELTKAFAGHPNYFPRFFQQNKKATGRLAFGARPGSLKPRGDESFTELLDSGLDPFSWNPFEMVAKRVLEGSDFREASVLIEKMKIMRLAVHKEDAGKGWRTPEVGPAFSGLPYVRSDNEMGKTRPLFVSERHASILESVYGKKATLVVGGTDIAAGLRRVSTGAKRMKLMGSFFQHMDFAVRAGGVAFTPSGIKAGLPFKYPSLLMNMMHVSLRKAPRDVVRSKILSDVPFIEGRNISYRRLAQHGWNVGGDTSIFQRMFTDVMEDLAGNAPPGAVTLARTRIDNLVRFMEAGLFQGVYRVTQMWTLENFILPKIIRQHGKRVGNVAAWTDEQIMFSAGAEVNKMFSTLLMSQSIMTSPASRALSQAVMFSTNETESFFKQAAGLFKGPNKQLWTEYGTGLMLYMGFIGNLLNFYSTGQSMPTEAYSPITFNSPYAFIPGGPSYNSKFLSPQLPFPGRGGAPLFADIVGQMDTVFRWILDPPGALTARFNVLPRAVMNQAKGEDFFGRPIEGLQNRVLQAFDDLVAPIGPGQLTDVLREQVPAVAEYIPEREARLGNVGSIIQATGLNLRSFPTPDMLDRVAALSGLQTADGQPVRFWADLEPWQRDDLEQSEPLRTEVDRRTKTSIERQQLGAEYRVRQDESDEMRVNQEVALVKQFQDGTTTGREFRDRYGEIQGERNRSRIDINKDFGRFQEERELPEDLNRKALTQFYQAHEKATSVAGTYDGDKAAVLIADLERIWTPEQKAYIKRNSGLTDHPDFVNVLRDGRKRFAFYFRVHEQLLGGSETLINQYEAFIGLSGDFREEALELTPQLRDIQNQVKRVRERMRELSPDLEAWLFQFEYVRTLRNPQNQGRQEELAPWLRGRRATARGL